MSVLLESLALGLLFSGAILLLSMGLRAITLRSRMRTWTHIQGTVRSSSVHSRRRHYRPQFVVDYAVRRDRITVTCESPTRSAFSASPGAYALLARYPVGSQVLLYVDPDDPARAFLWLPELPTIAFLLIGAGVLFLVTAIGCASAFNLDVVGLLVRYL